MNVMVLKLSVKEIAESSEAYFRNKCGFTHRKKNLEKSLKASEAIFKKYFAHSEMDILIKRFGKNHIINDEFVFGNNRIFCNVLNRIDHSNILGGYMYIFCAPSAEIPEDDILEEFYADTWQTAFIDAARDKLREKIIELAKKDFKGNVFLTDSFGPGYYGIDGNTVPYFYEYINGKEAGIVLTKYGMMDPTKSFIGMFLVMDQESSLPPRDCSSCLANKRGCEFCKNVSGRVRDAI